jgi:uracil-DNA glycosylase
VIDSPDAGAPLTARVEFPVPADSVDGQGVLFGEPGGPATTVSAPAGDAASSPPDPSPPAPSAAERAPVAREQARRPLEEMVEAGWAEALRPVAADIAAMGDFLRREVAAGRGYLPAGPNILRAFQQPFADVRVLIVGQDPYPTPGHPVGLSFSVAPDVRPLPRSLQNIFREYVDDLGYPMPSTGDLSPWTRQGVLLLNRVLTVTPGRPASHRGKGWEKVTDQAIRALVARGTPLVAILWGRDAQSLRPLLGNVPRIESPHPSPMSADRGFFGSRPFSRANALLHQQGGEPIDWRLP